jgi:hypothetical protein
VTDIRKPSHYHFGRSESKVVDTARIYAVVSTEDEDRSGDVVRATGWDLTYFRTHPVLLVGHDYKDIRATIGRWEELDVRDGKLEGVCQYYAGDGNPLADWAHKLALRGEAAYSVGFIPDMTKAKDKPKYGKEFCGQELLEISQVNVPSNRQSVQAMKMLGLDCSIEELLREVADPGPLEAALELVRAQMRDELLRIATKDVQVISDAVAELMDTAPGSKPPTISPRPNVLDQILGWR